MRNKKEEILIHYYLAKNKLRSTCMKKCLDLKNNFDYLNDTETECLTNCSSKMNQFLGIAHEIYLRDLKALEN